MDNQTQALESINQIMWENPQNAEAYLVLASIDLNNKNDSKDESKAYRINLDKAKEFGISRSLFTIKDIN